jgi:hypothetical protein
MERAEAVEAMPTPTQRSTRAVWWLDASVFGVIALVLRLPAHFASRSLIFGDGVYAASPFG